MTLVSKTYMLKMEIIPQPKSQEYLTDADFIPASNGWSVRLVVAPQTHPNIYNIHYIRAIACKYIKNEVKWRSAQETRLATMALVSLL